MFYTKYVLEHFISSHYINSENLPIYLTDDKPYMLLQLYKQLHPCNNGHFVLHRFVQWINNL